MKGVFKQFRLLLMYFITPNHWLAHMTISSYHVAAVNIIESMFSIVLNGAYLVKKPTYKSSEKSSTVFHQIAI